MEVLCAIIAQSTSHAFKGRSDMEYKLSAYGMWERCCYITNGIIELIVTLEVGPRIIRFGFINQRNEFHEYIDQVALKNDGKYHSYGGHRIWVAPETDGWTNHPDNNPVEMSLTNNTLHFTASPEAGTQLQKQLSIQINPIKPQVSLFHTIVNKGTQPTVLSPWAISVMAPGGRAIFPQEPFIPHPHKVLPARPLVLWHYTNMQDDRWIWGNRFIQLKQDSSKTTPQKCGALISQGWLAYFNNDHLFIKKFPCYSDAQYPDFGCNAEIFTNAKMLELESLGPIVTLQPNSYIVHKEQWYLVNNIAVPENELEIEIDFLSFFNY